MKKTYITLLFLLVTLLVKAQVTIIEVGADRQKITDLSVVNDTLALTIENGGTRKVKLPSGGAITPLNNTTTSTSTTEAATANVVRELQEQINAIPEIALEKKPFLLTEKSKAEIKRRFDEGYNLGTGFADEVQNILDDVASFTVNPSEFRPFFERVGETYPNIPSAGVNLHTTAVYADVIGDDTLANTVVSEILATANANDWNSTYWTTLPSNTRFDATNDLWIVSGKVKKLFDSYHLLKNIQNTLTDLEIATLEEWFKTYKELAESFVKTRLDGQLGADWEYVGRTVFTNSLYPFNANDSTPTPIYDATGNVIEAYTMTLGQDPYNNRQMDAVNYIHTWAIHNEDAYSEYWTRQFFKSAIKYGSFSDGTWCELFRNVDGDEVKGVYYGYVTLTGMLEMAHNDALACHFPNDKLYEYETTEGILHGSTNITSTPYVGGSTTDGVTKKSIFTFLEGQSNYLRTAANGGWNDTRFFKLSDDTVVPLTTVNKYMPSVHFAIANLYKKNQELKDAYTYNQSVGYPQKQSLEAGYSKPFANEDAGAWFSLINGLLWYEQEDNFFPYEAISKNNITEEVKVNLYDKSVKSVNQYLSANNFITASASYNTTGYIEVVEGVTYSSNHGMRFTTYFDENKNNVTGGSSDTVNSFTVPVGVKYVRASFNSSNDDTFMLVKGKEVGSYIPFVDTPNSLSKKLESAIVDTSHLFITSDVTATATNNFRITTNQTATDLTFTIPTGMPSDARFSLVQLSTGKIAPIAGSGVTFINTRETANIGEIITYIQVGNTNTYYTDNTKGTAYVSSGGSTNIGTDLNTNNASSLVSNTTSLLPEGINGGEINLNIATQTVISDTSNGEVSNVLRIQKSNSLSSANGGTFYFDVTDGATYVVRVLTRTSGTGSGRTGFGNTINDNRVSNIAHTTWQEANYTVTSTAETIFFYIQPDRNGTDANAWIDVLISVTQQ